VVGALDEPRVKKTLELPPDEIPQVILPVGHPRRKPRRS
jgi:hypothetical protein